MKKQRNITLFHEKLGKRIFKEAHAERILRMPRNGGWVFPKDSKYKLGENGIVRKTSTGTTEEPAK